MTKVKEPRTTSGTTTDGRALRSERSQKAIVDAMAALVAESPNALSMDNVAERAGVSVRTVFRHFEDTDALFEALYERFGAEAVRIGAAWSPVGSVEGDLAALVDARIRMFVYVAPLRRFARNARLPPPRARARFTQARRQGRAQLRAVFEAYGPRIEDDVLEALDAWISLEVWERLREHQGNSHARALRVFQATARALAQAATERVPHR